MPLYEYTCPDCEKDCELLIRGGETAACPTCGGVRLEKQFSVVAAHTGRGGRDLPVCSPAPMDGGCGLPQCGTGGCQMM